MFLVVYATVVALAAGSVFLLAYYSPERAARPEGPRWRAFRNGLRRRRHRAGAVDVSLAEMLRSAETEEPITPFAAFDQVRQRAVEQAARAAGLAAALVAREPKAERDQVPTGPSPDLSFPQIPSSELEELARAELALAELTLAKIALAEPGLTGPEPAAPALASDQDTARPDTGPGPEPARRERVRAT